MVVFSHASCPSFNMSEGAASAEQPNFAAIASQSQPSEGEQRTSAIKRLRYEGGPGEEGYERKMKIVSACWAFKASLLRKRVEKSSTQKSKGEIFEDIAQDMNKYHTDLFYGILKSSAVEMQWKKAITDADKQQEDKEKNKHLWYNGNIMREMTSYETLLDQIFVDRRKMEEGEKKKQEDEAAEERDARDRQNAAFNKVANSYNAGDKEQSFVTPEKRKAMDETEDEESEENGSQASSSKTTSSSNGRGTKKGMSGNPSASGAPGLSPDKPKTEMEMVLEKQDQMLAKADSIAKGGDDAAAVRQADAAMMQGTAALMAQVLAFQQAGVPIPKNIMKMLSKA